MTNQERFRSLFEYRAGRLYWKAPRRGIRKGAEAGSPDKDGYLRVGVQGKRHAVHRVVWCMLYGEIPQGMTVDHIDMDKRNNRIENLRLLSRGDNARAATIKPRSCNTTGVPGVHFNERLQVYTASIRVHGKLIHLGTASDLELAARLRREGEERHGFASLHNTVQSHALPHSRAA